ncbi:hypothetical protein [Burkholderia phage FLC9]|nr:hypothetical protein [Burkholderia phage FLC9]
MLKRLLPKWELGRQLSGYRILTLVNNKRFKVDMHVIYYPTGSSIPPHKDKANFDQRHYRLNIEVRRPKLGGKFECEKCIFRWWRIALFRPDEQVHSVTKIETGTRWVLSFGWLRKPAKQSLRDIKFD